tara:strand:+ start:1039 stop:1227 length:189 start_codon:yes stop_codon:yes gene_type:complete
LCDIAKEGRLIVFGPRRDVARSEKRGVGLGDITRVKGASEEWRKSTKQRGQEKERNRERDTE